MPTKPYDNYVNELIQVAAVALAAAQNHLHGSTKLDYEGMGHAEKLLGLVYTERRSQEKKWGPQKHTRERWMTILVEIAKKLFMKEVGEAARDVLETDR